MQRRLINGQWFQVVKEWRLDAGSWPMVELSDGSFMLINSKARTEPINEAVLHTYLSGDDLVRGLRWLNTPGSLETAQVMEVLHTFDLTFDKATHPFNA